MEPKTKISKKYNIRRIIKNYYSFLIFTLVVSVFILSIAIKNNSLLIYYGDSYEQQLAFYLGGWEKFHSLDFSLWDWSLGLGANYLSTVFNYATSPFFFITLLLPKGWVAQSFLYINGLKLYLLLFASYFWLRSVGHNKYISTNGSLVLSFSGWVAFFLHYNSFLDSFIFYPIILMLLEKYMKHGKFFTLTLMIGLLGIVNFYFLYMFLPFLVLYFTYRINHIKSINLMQFISDLLKLIFLIFIGIGISSIILMPSAYIILEAPRVKNLNFSDLTIMISKYDAYRYFSTLFTPVMERFDPTYFMSVSIYKGLGWAGGTSLYTSFLFPLLVLIVIQIKNSKSKTRIFIVYSVILFLCAFLIFYKILQGTIDVRWFYMITITNVYFTCELLEIVLQSGFNSKSIKFALFSTLSIIFSLYFYSRWKNWTGSETHQIFLLFTCIYAATLVISYSVGIYIKSKPLVLMIVILEVIISFSIPLNIDPPIKFSEFITVDLTKMDAIAYLKQIDKGFYRILNDTDYYSTPNDPKAKNYRGISFYSSVYNYSQEDYLSRFKGTWSMPVNFGRNYSYMTLSVKYFVTKNRAHTPPFGFDFYKKINKEYIYKNRYFYELGFWTNNTISENTFRSLSYLNQDRALLNNVVVTNGFDDMAPSVTELVNVASWVNPEYFATTDIPDNSFNLYIETFDIPKIEIRSKSSNPLLNNGSYNSFDYWQYNYTGQYFDKKDDIASLEILTENLYQSPTYINVYFEKDLESYDKWFEYVQNRSFKDVEISHDRITATININRSEAWVSTSVPFDKGWHLKIDGKETSFESVNLGFIGFKLKYGAHRVELYYRSPLILIGTMISIFSVVILAFVEKKRKLK